ncbi:MAG: hypothetical protein SWE60_11805 [Thermodesulfobacteriota bacterium]|nr:hypothetical protein [Thermodesulfobacteriota bacterium]
MIIENSLYTIVTGEKESDGQTVQVKPTAYLLSLEPLDAIDKLQANVQSIAQELDRYSKDDLETPEKIEAVRDLIFQLEIAQGYLAEVFKSWQATQGGQA